MSPTLVRGALPRPARRIQPTHPRLRAVLGALVLLGVPAAFLLAAGLLGTHLDTESSVVGTTAVFVLLLVGCPITLVALSRALLRSRAATRTSPALQGCSSRPGLDAARLRCFATPRPAARAPRARSAGRRRRCSRSCWR